MSLFNDLYAIAGGIVDGVFDAEHERSVAVRRPPHFATVQAYETSGTLALSAGPYQAAALNRPITIRVICN